MKKKSILLSAAAVLSACLLSCGMLANANVEKTVSNNRTTYNLQPSIAASPSKGAEVSLLSGGIYEVASNYDPTAYATEAYWRTGDNYAPESVEVTWTSDEGASYYTVKVATNKGMKEAQKYVTYDEKIILSDLYIGTHYYYQIIAKFANKTVKSRIFDFYTADLPRTIYIDGVSNTRDAGGCLTEDGKSRIKQGMIYRGGELEDITEEGKEQFLYTYGIQTDLDLRGNNGSSPVSSDVNYIGVSGPWYTYADGILADKYKEALKTEIKTYANADNYPIYVHCSLGRDRTGTIMFLINALCGVGKVDLYRDYELSFFSVKGCADESRPTYLVEAGIGALYNYMSRYSDGTLAENTEKFMLDLGITSEEIASIRSILLEEVK